ncbi:MAG: PKD domain-containing protein [Nitrospinota bacterium]
MRCFCWQSFWPRPDKHLQWGGPIVLSGDDSDDGGHCEGSRCGQMIGKTLSFIVNNSQSSGSGILAIGVNSGRALSSLNGWNTPTHGGPNVAITHARTTTEIANANFSDYAMIYIPSDNRNTGGGITSTQMTALNARQADIADFVNNNGGGLFALTENGLSNRYGWLPVPLTIGGTGHSTNIFPTPDMNIIAPGTTGLSHCCYHNTFTGPAGFSGLKVLAYHDHNGNRQFDGRSVDHVIMLGGVQVTIQGNIELDPPNTTLTTGDQHTLTATAEDGNPLAPAAGVTVDFMVDGANAGASGTCNNAGCTTDANGQVSFTYTGNNEGTDRVVASFIDGNGTTQTSNTADVIWETPPNQPPVADAGPDQTVEQEGPTGSDVTLNGSGSSDPDGDPLTYNWSTGDTVANPSVHLSAGTHNITLIVNDGTVDSDPDTVQVIVQDTIAPAITTSDLTVEATGVTTPVDIAAVTSATDAVGPVTLTNNNAGPYPLGSTTVIWEACDAAGNCSTATQTVTVVDTTPPAITTQDITVEATGPTTPVDIAAVTSATDAVGVVSLTNDNAGPYPVGSTTVTWTACDGAIPTPNCSTETQTVTITDTTPPDISNACLTDKLWPPNHKMVLVSTGSVSDIADPDATFSVAVTSNQPINGTGDGNTDPDWTVNSTSSGYEVSLRAERAGNLGQRDYTIEITATDASGNTAQASCSASVPHDQGNNNSRATKKKGKK